MPVRLLQKLRNCATNWSNPGWRSSLWIKLCGVPHAELTSAPSALRVCVWEQKVASPDSLKYAACWGRTERQKEKTFLSVGSYCFTDSTRHCCQDKDVALCFSLLCKAEHCDSCQTWWWASGCEKWMEEICSFCRQFVDAWVWEIPSPPWRSLLCCKLLLGVVEWTHCCW